MNFKWYARALYWAKCKLRFWIVFRAKKTWLYRNWRKIAVFDPKIQISRRPHYANALQWENDNKFVFCAALMLIWCFFFAGNRITSLWNNQNFNFYLKNLNSPPTALCKCAPMRKSARKLKIGSFCQFFVIENFLKI